MAPTQFGKFHRVIKSEAIFFHPSLVGGARKSDCKTSQMAWQVSAITLEVVDLPILYEYDKDTILSPDAKYL